MATTDDAHTEGSAEARSAPPKAAPTEARQGTGAVAAPAEQAAHPDHPVAADSTAPAAQPRFRSWRKRLLLAGALVLLVGLGFFLVPWLKTILNTISTDDAYINGHPTFVAPRVAGRVIEVRVEDNQRVKKGDVLVRIDTKPFKVQVDIKKAAVAVAERDQEAALAQARGLVAQTRSYRFKLENTIEEVNHQIANLGGAVATLKSRRATLVLSRNKLKRGEELSPTGISKENLDERRQTVKVDEAAVQEALQAVYAIRASLGLPDRPMKNEDRRQWWHFLPIYMFRLPATEDTDDELAEVPKDLDQQFSGVREALATLEKSAAQLGYFPTSWDSTPKQTIADFYKQDEKGDLNRIYDRLVHEAPAVKQAEAKVLQAKSDLADAELNLSYCDVLSDIDGQVTSRNVNEGNYVQVGQSLMAVRSLTKIWIDANFKETQLADLRIGQLVRCEIDMYGSRHEYEGRVTGFTMGTGQTLSLLPPQNATGNFVKIVQRLPVRIELTNYDPDRDPPLFLGLSVTPYVYYKKPTAGPHAGEVLQPYVELPKGSN